MLLVLAAMAVGSAFLTFGDVFLARIAEQGLSDEGRPRAMTLAIGSILLHRFWALDMGRLQQCSRCFGTIL